MEKVTLVFEDVGESNVEIVNALRTNLEVSVKEAVAIVDSCPCKITDLPSLLAAELESVICNRKGRAYVQRQNYTVYKFESSVTLIN